MASVTFAAAGKVYPNGTRALSDFDLQVADGEFMVFVGPSGCGKTTALRMVAGLETITDGEVRIGDRVVNRLEPQERDIAMVFQNYALYPHMSVRDNIGFGLKMRKVGRDERRRRIEDIGRVLGLEELLDRRPRHLSGGQRQRVAMGRAIVRDPAAFLMDEPLSNLDAKLRVDMRAQLARLHAELGVTTVYVTHDQVEAMTLGQRVAVMRDGRVQQVDTPQNLYRRPANLFVAAFIGSPPMNLVEADAADGRVSFAGIALPAPAGVTGRVIVGIRPQDLAAADEGELSVEPAVVEDLGSATNVIFPVDAPSVDTEAVRAATDEGDTAVLLHTDRRALFTASLPEGTSVRPGTPLRLRIDTTRLHFFDTETGERLDA